MFKRIALCALCLFEACPQMRAQLHVIAGTASDSRVEPFAAYLVRVADDGTVSRAASLVPGPSSQNRHNRELYTTGSAWIDVARGRTRLSSYLTGPAAITSWSWTSEQQE